MVGIFVGVNIFYIEKKNMQYAKETIKFNHFKVFDMYMAIYARF